MNEYLKNGIKLISANIVAQVTAFMLVPFIARLYAPEELGTLTLFLTLGGILAMLGNGKYEYAIVQAGNRKEAASLFSLCLLINTSLHLLITILLLLAGNELLHLLKNYDAISNYKFYLPLYSFILALAGALTGWFNYHKRFNLTARYNFIQIISNGVFKIAAGLLSMKVTGLILSNVASHLSGIACAISQRHVLRGIIGTDKKAIKTAAAKYANYPKYSLARTVVNMIATNLPVLILSVYFNMEEIGFISMAITLAFRPLNILSLASNQVLFKKYSEMKNRKIQMWKSMRKLLVKSSAGMAIAFAAIYICLDWLTSIILGSEWAECSTYIKDMYPWLLISVFGASLDFIPDVFQRQKGLMLSEMLLFAGRLAGLVIGISSGDIHTAISVYSWMSFVFIFLQLTWYVRLIRQYDRRISATQPRT